MESRFAAAARAAFLGAAAVFTLLLLRSVLNAPVYTVDAFAAALAFGVPAAGAVFCLGLAFAPKNARINAFLAAVFCAVPLYGMEAYLGARGDVETALRLTKEAAEAAGRPYDPRKPSEIIAEERASGARIIGVGAANNIPFHSPVTGPMFVRGSVSNARVLGGNESGAYVFYKTDEKGFKNPAGIWNEDKIDVMVFGDSFVHATSVTAEQDIPGVIRETFPGSLNLGHNGIGPLYYYQTFLEYAGPKRPRFSVFVWFEGNDVTDLREELSTPLLKQLLTQTEPKGLFNLQDELDAHYQAQLDFDLAALRVPLIERGRQFLMLVEMRKRLGLGAAGARNAAAFENAADGYPPLPAAELQTILTNARAAAAGWGGRVMFVYLPAWRRLCPHMKNPPPPPRCPDIGHNYRRPEVLSAARAVGLEIIDIAPVMAAHPDPAAFFYYAGSHYSPEGYRLVGETIARRLAALAAE